MITALHDIEAVCPFQSSTDPIVLTYPPLSPRFLPVRYLFWRLLGSLDRFTLSVLISISKPFRVFLPSQWDFINDPVWSISIFWKTGKEHAWRGKVLGLRFKVLCCFKVLFQAWYCLVASNAGSTSTVSSSSDKRNPKSLTDYTSSNEMSPSAKGGSKNLVLCWLQFTA